MASSTVMVGDTWHGLRVAILRAERSYYGMSAECYAKRVGIPGDGPASRSTCSRKGGDGWSVAEKRQRSAEEDGSEGRPRTRTTTATSSVDHDGGSEGDDGAADDPPRNHGDDEPDDSDEQRRT